MRKKMCCMMIKVFVFCIFAASVFWMSEIKVAAGNVYTNQETGYVIHINDEADLLTDAEEKLLASEIEPFTEYGNVVFWSNPENGASSSTATNDYYVAHFGWKDGLIFGIDMRSREIVVRNFGALKHVISSGESNSIMDNVYRYATREEYYTCASKAYEQLYTLLRGGMVWQPMKYICNFLVAITISILLNYFLARRMSGSGKIEQTEKTLSVTSRCKLKDPAALYVRTEKIYNPPSSGGGSGSSGGGGGGGGGGSSGGSHSF